MPYNDLVALPAGIALEIEKMRKDKQTDDIEKSTAVAGQNERRVMPTVVGYVSYDVRVKCPHCDKSLHLNQYPYDNDETEYCLAEDELGLALFGRTNAPATWNGLDIEYKCCDCKEIFYLGSLEP
jgi:hypothetical protein